MVSLKDVAKRANVSLMTVSRAINHPHLLKPDTLKVVLDAVNELGYVSDLSAKKIRGAKNEVKTIGVLAMDTMTTPFSVDITLSIEETARENGWNSFVVNMFANDKPEKIVDLLLAHRPHGIIYTAMGLRSVPVPKKLLSTPCVLANCESTEARLATYVPHDEQGQYEGCLTLFKQGYKKPLCINLPVELLATPRRQAGLLRACEKMCIPKEALIQHHLPLGDEHHIYAKHIVEHYIVDGKPLFDSVICGNDRVAFVVYQVLLSYGLRIPEDIGILGYDNMVGIGDLFCPSLSTVQLPHYEMGKQSVLHIINKVAHRNKVFISSPFLKRHSF